MIRLLVTAMLAAMAGACTARPFDRHVAAGRPTEALSLFEQDSTLQQRPEAIYRAAQIYASPDLESYAPAEARRLFARVYEMRPTSAEGQSALRFMLLLDEMERTRMQLEHRQVLLMRERDQLATAVSRLIAERDAARARATGLAEQQAVAAHELARVQSALRSTDAELQNLRDELERLKAIDLRPVQRPTGGNDDGSRR